MDLHALKGSAAILLKVCGSGMQSMMHNHPSCGPRMHELPKPYSCQRKYTQSTYSILCLWHQGVATKRAFTFITITPQVLPIPGHGEREMLDTPLP